jgi:hypothetical protein
MGRWSKTKVGFLQIIFGEAQTAKNKPVVGFDERCVRRVS